MFGLAPRARTARPSKLQPPIAGKDGDSLMVGRRVRTHPKGLTGYIRWVGATHFSDGVWIGVELDTPDGRNDGEVQGTRYFNCTRGHGVFVRPDHCVAIKEIGGKTPMGALNPAPTPLKSHPQQQYPHPHQQQQQQQPQLRPRLASFSGGGEKSGLARTSSRSSLISENSGTVEVRRGSGLSGSHKRETPSNDGDEQAMFERLVASEAFTRAVEAAVAERVRAEMAQKELQTRAEEEAVSARVDQLEQMVDDCGGAMDDIAVMIQEIHDKVSAPEKSSSSSDDNTDSQDAAGGSAGRKGSFNAGGDAGGGGRDDARVGYLTQLLSNVHIMSTQAADLLRAERKDKNARIEYLSNRVRDLEQVVSGGSNGRSTSAGSSKRPSGEIGVQPPKPPTEPMEG